MSLISKLALYFFAFSCCNAAYFSTPYSSIDQAASTCLREVMPQSKADNAEYGGGIYMVDGQYFCTPAESQHGEEKVSIHIRIPKSAKFVGLYHTHPSFSAYYGDSEMFSATDVKVALALNVPSYIGVLSSNTIHRFIPHVDKTYTVLAFDSHCTDRVTAGEIL
jgi:uncharacterized protein DUF4329